MIRINLMTLQAARVRYNKKYVASPKGQIDRIKRTARQRNKRAEERLARNAYMREYNTRPGKRKKASAVTKAWIKRSPENIAKHRANSKRAKRRYVWGDAADDYDARLAKQNNLCALCGGPFDDSILGRPAQDHNHITRELRGFIHVRCNLGLGNFLDSPEQCRKAAMYLEKYD
jgi:hypothetical protein